MAGDLGAPARRRLVQALGLAALVPSWPGLRAQPAAGGTTWASVPFGGGGFVDGFVYHPRERGLLYARTDIGGAYRFDPRRQSWRPLLDHLSRADSDLMGVLSLALDPTDPERVYAACGLYDGPWARHGALLASTDRGATWQVHELGLKIGGNMPGRGTGERLAVDPNRPERLWLGTTRDGLRVSDDRGQRFTAVDFPGRHASLVLCDAASGKPGAPTPVVWAGAHDKPGLYVSRDGGRRFEREPGPPEQVPQRAALGPDGVLYVSFGRGEGVGNPGSAAVGSVWKRTPDGRWSDISPLRASGFGYAGLDCDARVPGRLVVSTIERWSEGDEVFLSTDGGAQWTPLTPRSHHDTSRHPWLAAYRGTRRVMGHWIADLKIDPHDGAQALYGTGYGVWATKTLGAERIDWRFAVDGMEETAVLDLRCPSGGAALLAAMGDVGGGAWDDLSRGPDAGLFRPTNETNRGVDFAELNPGVLARTSDRGPHGGHVSTDGGARWAAFGAHEARGGGIAVSAGGGFFLRVPERRAALWSRDRGRTWAESEGWPADRERTLAPVADRTVEGVFHVLDPARGELLTSVDGGRRFAPSVTGLPPRAAWQATQLLAVPGALREFWVVLHDTLLHLPGADRPPRVIEPVAEAWMMALGKGAPGSAQPWSLYVWGRVRAGGLVAAEGLFRSDDAGLSFVRINDDAHRYGRLLAMAADPLEHGTVFLAPHGRGVIVGRLRA